MITGFFLYLLYALLSFLVGILPTLAFPASFASALNVAWYYVNALSFLLPMTTLLTVLGFAMAFHAAVLIWRLIHLIGGYLRGR